MWKSSRKTVVFWSILHCKKYAHLFRTRKREGNQTLWCWKNNHVQLLHFFNEKMRLEMMKIKLQKCFFSIRVENIDKYECKSMQNVYRQSNASVIVEIIRCFQIEIVFEKQIWKIIIKMIKNDRVYMSQSSKNGVWCYLVLKWMHYYRIETTWIIFDGFHDRQVLRFMMFSALIWTIRQIQC